MATETKIYKVQDFIRKNEAGELTEDRIREIIMEIVAAAALHPKHNILIDTRETRLSWPPNMMHIMKTALELAAYTYILTGKIANIIPGGEKRRAIAEKMEAAIQIKGISYRVFTEFEDAFEWLAGDDT